MSQQCSVIKCVYNTAFCIAWLSCKHEQWVVQHMCRLISDVVCDTRITNEHVNHVLILLALIECNRYRHKLQHV